MATNVGKGIGTATNVFFKGINPKDKNL